jgi:A/G-specific adenine glycosylase
LLRWYDLNRRLLPWRESHHPYRIWISEIMLQQTRVAAVVPYYQRFLARFPDVNSLARAREAAVLAAWSGLGYYRRARHLHAAARRIAADGTFPRTSCELRELPGIGRYTAAAIASIAFGERCAVVDGNVERVLARVSSIRLSREQAWVCANELLSRTRPGDFNQAMMELGATICTPKAPQCSACPVAKFCGTRGEHPESEAALPRQRQRLVYALGIRGSHVLLVKRSRKAGLMPGMWELPEPGRGASPSGFTEENAPPLRLRHAILDIDYDVRVVAAEEGQAATGKWVRISRLSQLALTGLARKILLRAGVL